MSLCIINCLLLALTFVLLAKHVISRYPMSPPIVRFLTKIVHPNVSRHGDVGIDIIQHNWSLALTISKLLLSVQSLLTDPFTEVLQFHIHIRNLNTISNL